MKFRGKMTPAGQSALSQVIGHLAKTRGGSSKDRRFTVVNLKISPVEFTLGCSALDDGSPETWAHLAVECIFDSIDCQSLREGNYIDLVASLENLLAAAQGLGSSTSTEIRLRNKSGLAVLAFTYTIPQAYDPSVGGQAFVKAFYDVPITLFNFDDLEGCRRSIETLKRAMGNKLEKFTLEVSPTASAEGEPTVKVSVSASSPLTTMSLTYCSLPVLRRQQESQEEEDNASTTRPLLAAYLPRPEKIAIILARSDGIDFQGRTGGDVSKAQVSQPLIGSSFATEVATRGFRAASERVTAAAEVINKRIHTGPDSIRVLAFLGGVAVTATGALNVLSPSEVLHRPVIYLLNLYQILFGVITCLLEADPKYLHKYGVQERIHEYAYFLTQLWGRGLFYLFQGSIALMHLTILYIIVGLYMAVIGVLSLSLLRYNKDGGEADQTSQE
ncbi:hypothetical protein Pmar_PMAR011530 [Perkinsus marinus ATCC 50983]|uniref:Uncharacterized protein n=1 Tax=Perkinsus marinus (strain ATCC 50983 / TXsc) TaxID=423536 RepID=C5LC22_PERM5|nr:hypothetical protein Pmar_PMAR011530 [Perkinsus marinus ATCC 50983]EER05505.1 hypothetical protein Pmar_PMAR011530 [Perkinsus marinus ATCC 50983]|eukprot:XP_002773689.1 hypothetical protein Pmar_PMAR011530 [Perkinsus marinus ATCC 50983]